MQKIYKANINPYKKPVGRKMFFQGSEILQVFKNSSKEKKPKPIKISKCKTPPQTTGAALTCTGTNQDLARFPSSVSLGNSETTS